MKHNPSEALAIGLSGAGEECCEKLAAFLTKRPPTFDEVHVNSMPRWKLAILKPFATIANFNSLMSGKVSLNL